MSINNINTGFISSGSEITIFEEKSKDIEKTKNSITYSYDDIDFDFDENVKDLDQLLDKVNSVKLMYYSDFTKYINNLSEEDLNDFKENYMKDFDVQKIYFPSLYVPKKDDSLPGYKEKKIKNIIEEALKEKKTNKKFSSYSGEEKIAVCKVLKGYDYNKIKTGGKINEINIDKEIEEISNRIKNLFDNENQLIENEVKSIEEGFKKVFISKDHSNDSAVIFDTNQINFKNKSEYENALDQLEIEVFPNDKKSLNNHIYISDIVDTIVKDSRVNHLIERCTIIKKKIDVSEDSSATPYILHFVIKSADELWNGITINNSKEKIKLLSCFLDSLYGKLYSNIEPPKGFDSSNFVGIQMGRIEIIFKAKAHE